MKLEKSKLSTNVKTVAQMRPDRRKVLPEMFSLPDGRTHREDKLNKGDYTEGKFSSDTIKKAKEKVRGYFEDSKSTNSKNAINRTAREDISQSFKDTLKGKTSRERRTSGW